MTDVEQNDSLNKPIGSVESASNAVELTDINTPNNTLAEKQEFDSNVTIAFRNLTNTVQVPAEQGGYSTILTPFVNAAKFIGTLGKSSQTVDFHRIDNISGLIKPGTMTLVIAPPGHGMYLIVLHLLHVVYNNLILHIPFSYVCTTYR